MPAGTFASLHEMPGALWRNSSRSVSPSGSVAVSYTF
jgi:hypothetical protein